MMIELLCFNILPCRVLGKNQSMNTPNPKRPGDAAIILPVAFWETGESRVVIGQKRKARNVSPGGASLMGARKFCPGWKKLPEHRLE
jgi:hypothetical protein